MADFVPYSTHSLNLVDINSIESCIQTLNYFGLVQAVYMFFSSSIKRWKLLTDNLKRRKKKNILEPLSKTRWLSDANIVKAFQNGYNIILLVLSNIFENKNEKPQFKVKINNLLKKRRNCWFTL